MTDTAPAPQNARPRATIVLGTPVRRGDSSIDSIALRKPVAGELRGLNLQQIGQSDVSSLITLVPRISEPPLTQPEVEAMEPEDLSAIGSAVFDFFLTSAQRAQIRELLGS